MPRLGTLILATIAKQEGWDAAVYIEEMAEIDFEDVLQADVVGISTITSTAPRAYEIADRLREKGKTVREPRVASTRTAETAPACGHRGRPQNRPTIAIRRIVYFGDFPPPSLAGSTLS